MIYSLSKSGYFLYKTSLFPNFAVHVRPFIVMVEFRPVEKNITLGGNSTNRNYLAERVAQFQLRAFRQYLVEVRPEKYYCVNKWCIGCRN
jgi:hypothetical protein